MVTDSFTRRHIGPGGQETNEMLAAIKANSMEALIAETIPENIRLKNELNLPEAQSEFEYLNHITNLAKKNNVFKSYIGLGYYNCIVPPVIQRNILENPGWYTAYTPYQAEISQGRLEGLLNFQTMVSDLTGLPIANASLLDEGTAAAEAMLMFFNTRSREAAKNGANKFFVSEKCFPQTVSILETRATPLNIELVIGNHEKIELNETFFGTLLQYPDIDGEVHNFESFVEKANSVGIKTAVAADLLSLALLVPPGEWGAEVVVGNTQRFGVPMGYGGPHAAYFATAENYKRNIPGRIIGVSLDAHGNPALRMALQTREQHIRRDKATSNICTAQALLAVMAGMYAVYHGPEGIKQIAKKVHSATSQLGQAVKELGYDLITNNCFDTITFQLPETVSQDSLRSSTLGAEINFRYGDNTVSISLDETVTNNDINAILDVLAKAIGTNAKPLSILENITIPNEYLRTSKYLQHEVFHKYRSETEMMRYLKRLENKDISLTHSMISLGSCTMKLNAAAELMPITMPEFANIHPFAPLAQASGYAEMIQDLEKWLCEITGFTAISFQPNSGAQGEYAGLMVIRKYHLSNNDNNRTVALIPASAHGTNPASAVMAGMKVVVVKCDDNGNIDVADLKTKAEQYKEELACLMVTYPSTHGVFEETIIEVNEIIHQNGGLVYMDGANMNAQVGLTNPANIGADVCHLNLHKTFAIPHGGGGPGMGPIGVVEKLVPFLPSHPIVETGGSQGIEAVSAAPWGSALILLISYGYLKMLGKSGVKKCTEMAILNANYLKTRVENKYKVLYVGTNGRVAHEMILDCREFKRTAQIEVADIAKRLIDFGFHAPTVSFPVAGTLMVEPTESESKEELDRFAEALLTIYDEIKEIENGQADVENNVLRNSPHTAETVTTDEWQLPYSRAKAAFPLSWIRNQKYWSPVGRVDNAHGDRNLICTCPSIEEFAEEPATV